MSRLLSTQELRPRGFIHHICAKAKEAWCLGRTLSDSPLVCGSLASIHVVILANAQPDTWLWERINYEGLWEGRAYQNFLGTDTGECTYHSVQFYLFILF